MPIKTAKTKPHDALETSWGFLGSSVQPVGELYSPHIVHRSLDVKSFSGATPLFVTRDFIAEIDRLFDDRSELEHHLLDDLEDIAVDLLGVPTGYSTWRWGPKTLIIKGLRRGWFDDWEAGVHGWPLKMIAHEINGDEAKAIAWARNWLGIGALPPPDAATLKAREKKRCQVAAVEAALQRFKIIQAQALWAHSTP